MKYTALILAIVAMAPLGAAAKIGNLWAFGDVSVEHDANGMVVANNATYAPADLDQRLSSGTAPVAEPETDATAPVYAPAPGPQFAPQQQQYAPAQQYPAMPNNGYAPFQGYAPNNNGGYGYSPFGYGSPTPYGNGYNGYPYNNGGYGGSFGNIPSGSSPFFGGNNSPFGFW